MSGQQTPEWQVKAMSDFSTGRPCGFTVQRVHNPYTDRAKVEVLRTSDGRNFFRTEAAARDAIAETTGEQS